MGTKVIKQKEILELREYYDLKELILYSDGYVVIDGCISVDDLLVLAKNVEEAINGRRLVE